MSKPFASGEKAIGICDRCGFQYLLYELKDEVVDLNETGLLVCPQCYDPDQPQLQVGRWPVDDPQALRSPRPDQATTASRRLTVVDWGFVKSFDDPDGTDYLVASPTMTVAWVAGGTITVTGITAQQNPELARSDQVAGSRAIQTVDLSSLERVNYFDGASYPYVRMGIKLNTAWVGTAGATGWSGKLYWNTVGNDAFDEAKTLAISEPDWTANDGGYQTAEWDLSSTANWTGNIDKVKILFNTDAAPWTTPGAYEIDYIRIENN